MVVEGWRGSRVGRDASKVDGNLSSGLEIITNVLLSNDSFIPIKYRPIRINTKFFWLRVTSSYLESLEKGGISLIVFFLPPSSSSLVISHTKPRVREKKLFSSLSLSLFLSRREGEREREIKRLRRN